MVYKSNELNTCVCGDNDDLYWIIVRMESVFKGIGKNIWIGWHMYGELRIVLNFDQGL